jgi:hypothetical protein
MVRHDRQQTQVYKVGCPIRRHTRLVHASDPLRLPSRRRSPRPLLLDAAALHHRQLSYSALAAVPIRDQVLPIHIWQAVPVLGVCRRLPELDEQKHAESQQQKRIWHLDV